jgi:hypothetical protein
VIISYYNLGLDSGWVPLGEVCDPCFILLPPMLLPPCNSDFLPRRPPRRRLPSVLLSPRLPPRRPALPPPPACHRSAAAPRSFYSWTPQWSSSPPPPLKTGNSNLNSSLPLPPPALNRHPTRRHHPHGPRLRHHLSLLLWDSDSSGRLE